VNAGDLDFALGRLIFAGVFRYCLSSVIMLSFEQDSKENLGRKLITEPDTYSDQRNLVHQKNQTKPNQNKINQHKIKENRTKLSMLTTFGRMIANSQTAAYAELCYNSQQVYNSWISAPFF